jgi:hypothetical protein
MAEEKAKASEEQLAYANFLSKGTWTALGLLVVLFIVYLSGILPNVVDFEKIQVYWKMRSSDFIHLTNSPTGWGWLPLINHGDMLPYIGIALLAGMTILSYLRILPIFLKKKDKPFTIIVLIELAVLLLAASGILTAGGH